jgi:hypothetical protein
MEPIETALAKHHFFSVGFAETAAVGGAFV